MTQTEAYDGAWAINTSLSPQKYYAYAERGIEIGHDDHEWVVVVERRNIFPDVDLFSAAAVKEFISEESPC